MLLYRREKYQISLKLLTSFIIDLHHRFRTSDARELVSGQMFASLHMNLGGSPNLSQRAMTEFYHNLSMQALSKSDDSVRVEFIAIVDLVKNIAQLLNDRIEAAIVSTKESDKYFASFLDEKGKGQKNMDEIDKVTTENSVEIKKNYTANCTIRRWNKKGNRQNKESFTPTKMEIDQPDFGAIERTDWENKERLIRKIVNPMTVWQLIIK